MDELNVWSLDVLVHRTFHVCGAVSSSNKLQQTVCFPRRRLPLFSVIFDVWAWFLRSSRMSLVRFTFCVRSESRLEQEAAQSKRRKAWEKVTFVLLFLRRSNHFPALWTSNLPLFPPRVCSSARVEESRVVLKDKDSSSSSNNNNNNNSTGKLPAATTAAAFVDQEKNIFSSEWK